MPILVNYSGENELYHGKLYHPKPVDSNTICSPLKRRQIITPFSVWGDKLERKKQTTMESLPDECLFEIFRRSQGKERSLCACVSKRWLYILSSIRKADICNPDLTDANTDPFEESEDGLLERCFEGKEATDLSLLAMAVGTASRGGLGELAVRGLNSSCAVTDFGLSAVARGCPALQSLSLYKASSVSDKGLSEIAKGCPMLEKLSLCYCPSITDEGLAAIAENCPNLSALTIECCSRIGNDGFQAIAQRCGRIDMISIKDCPLVGDQGIASLSSSKSLTKLKLNGLSISDFAVSVLGHYGKSFVFLSLSNLKNVSERGFWNMGDLHGLESLMILAVDSCLGMTDQSIEAIAKGCPALKQIIIRNCYYVSDEGLVAFAKSAVSIESVHLEEINRISLYGVISALSVCHSKLRSLALVSCVGLKDIALGGDFVPANLCRPLKSLSVKNCPGFGNAGLTVLGKMCPELRQLDLGRLYGVTDEGLLSVLQSCEGGLVKLKLNGCLNFSDEVITAAVKTHGVAIKIMGLEGCRKLTDVSLVAIAKHCQVLGDLDMSGCAITDSGLAVLSSAKQLKLEILSLSGCRGLSNKSVSSLIKMKPTLLGLNLQNCNSMSTKSIDLLDKKLPKCDLLY